MPARDASPRVVEVQRDRLEEAIEVLAAAFEHDTLAGYVLPIPGPERSRGLRELFRFACELRHVLGWPLLGCVQGTELQGVLGVTLPEPGPWPAELHAAHERFKAAIGPDAARRWEAYTAIADTCHPAGPHYQVGMIGVHPRAQGRGCARLLMDAVHALSEAHPRSIGVSLDTENPANVPFYEHFGYRVVWSRPLAALRVWCMFRPNG